MTNFNRALLVSILGIGGVLGLSGCINPCMKAPSSILLENGQTIAFLGDSITAGGAEYGNYCRLVVQGLKAKGIYVKPVMAGVPGNTTKDMLARLDKDVLSHHPDWVVIAAGVNDVWGTEPVKLGFSQPKPGTGIELADYQKNIHALVQRCTTAGTKVLLTTITTIREDPETSLNIKARAYNAFLLDLAQSQGLPIARLNEALFAEIAKGRRLTSDGVHPLVEGHRIMAKGILEAMGYTKAETDHLEQEWQTSPTLLILGDRQTTAGGRTGGWCGLLMDGMNSGREMFTYRTQAIYRQELTLQKMLADFRGQKEVKDRYVIVQAPRGDAVEGSSVDAYRQDLESLIAAILEKGSLPVLVTIPVQENNPAGDLSRKCTPYNEVIRAVANKGKTPIADISTVMAERYAARPSVVLSYDGERFNHEGSMLMAETLIRAMKLQNLITPELRQIWSESPFYIGKPEQGK
jgi:lysophospholipase L1-like esterase